MTKKQTIALGFTAGLIALTSARCAAQSGPELRIHSAVEVEYQTEIGKTYKLQGAVNLTNWTDLGNAVLGHGRLVDQIYSAKNDTASHYVAFRLVVNDGPTNGFAPWSLAGARVQMDEYSSSNFVEFASAENGHDVYSGAFDPFTYQFSRISENNARVDRTFTPDRNEILSYSYTGPGVGTWIREEYRQGALERRVLGVFRYLADTTNNLPGASSSPVVITAPQPPAPPSGLTGLVYYAQSGAQPDQLRFQTGSAGIENPTPAAGSTEGENEVSPGGNSFTYSYRVQSSNTASLIVNFGYYGFGGDKNEYDLTYTDGPSGTFVRRIYRLGGLYSTDTGAFNPFAPSPTSAGSTNPTPISADQPPANPVGLNYTIHDDSIPPRLVFQSTSSGIEFDDSGLSDFTFTYQATSTNTFNMIVRFKSDKWDEYQLTFTSGIQGSSVRRQFKNNRLDRTTAGPFTVALTGP